ncbi:YkvA family protein [Leeuwenhoekiella sp. A16]|uniref:YkvA family protein n=1 Tax=unclassified Leeuwenhoekiella TaxID=2615029 RepID=UPI003A80F9F0
MKKLKAWAKKLKQQLVMLHLASRDKRTPWYANAMIFLIIAYALSPIDLIPDFIPVIGYLDDLILLPIGIYFAISLIPEAVKAECLRKAKDYNWNKRKSWLIGGIIILFWSLIVFWISHNYFNF